MPHQETQPRSYHKPGVTPKRSPSVQGLKCLESFPAYAPAIDFGEAELVVKSTGRQRVAGLHDHFAAVRLHKPTQPLQHEGTRQTMSSVIEVSANRLEYVPLVCGLARETRVGDQRSVGRYGDQVQWGGKRGGQSCKVTTLAASMKCPVQGGIEQIGDVLAFCFLLRSGDA